MLLKEGLLPSFDESYRYYSLSTLIGKTNSVDFIIERLSSSSVTKNFQTPYNFIKYGYIFSSHLLTGHAAKHRLCFR